jgi:hypothetical protein
MAKIGFEEPKPVERNVVLILTRDELLHLWQGLGETNDAKRRIAIDNWGCELSNPKFEAHGLFTVIDKFCTENYGKKKK